MHISKMWYVLHWDLVVTGYTLKENEKKYIPWRNKCAARRHIWICTDGDKSHDVSTKKNTLKNNARGEKIIVVACDAKYVL